MAAGEDLVFLLRALGEGGGGMVGNIWGAALCGLRPLVVRIDQRWPGAYDPSDGDCGKWCIRDGFVLPLGDTWRTCD